MIKLWDGEVPGFNGDFGQEVPNITPYLVKGNKPNGAIIVCAGGGYSMKADHEGEPVALMLNKMGVSSFVLDYRVAPYRHPYPMMDAQRAVRYIRYKAEEWNIDRNKIGILGFSAGGHLAATVGTHFDYGNPDSLDTVERFSCRPDALILCYSVISFGKYRHNGSMLNLLGESPSEEMIDFLSNEKHISKDTPPTFLWHTADDSSVPVENSLLFAQELSKNKVSCELHIFPEGEHGLGLAQENESASIWTEFCGKWLGHIGFL